NQRRCGFLAIQRATGDSRRLVEPKIALLVNSCIGEACGNAMKASSGFDPRRLLAYAEVYHKFRRLVQSENSASRLVNDFLKIGPGQRVLDIGCGTADILAELPCDIDYHGYDIETAYVAAARQRYGHRGSFVVRSVSPEAVDDLGTFDVVISLG